MDMNNVIEDLSKRAKKEGIKVIWSYSLSPNTPSTVSTRYKVIVMNAMVHRSIDDYDDLAMELAHEISHIENGDDETAILPYSATKDVDYGIEHDANIGAIAMLLPYYLADFETDPTEINVVDFMHQFGVPLHFENCIREKINNIYSH
ncbi:hypothetical protein ACRYI5_00910 [Furfurilactobacillus sp. WILCCON 0119]